MRFQAVPKIGTEPNSIRHNELDGVLVVSEVDSMVVPVLLGDAVEGQVGNVALELGQSDLGIAFFQQDDIAVGVGVTGEVGEDVLDDGMGWIGRGQLGQVGDGLECQHGGLLEKEKPTEVSRLMGKKRRRSPCRHPGVYVDDVILLLR